MKAFGRVATDKQSGVHRGPVMRITFCMPLILTFLVGAAVVEAGQAATYRIGWVSAAGRDDNAGIDAFRAGMRDLGYIEGRNLAIDAHFGGGSIDHLDEIVVDLVKSNPQVIVTQAGQAIFAVRRAGATMPVVFGLSGDPVEAKLADSLARPGRNFTGVSFLSLDLVGKRMELLKETIPSLKRVAVLANPAHPGEQSELRESQAAAKALGLVLSYVPARPGPEYDTALPAVAKSRADAMVVFPDAGVIGNSEKFAAFSVKNRIPAISGWAEFAEKGNVMTYGPTLSEGYRRLAVYVDKILKGVKPADIPIELPTKFELVINLKTAKQIGLTIPPNVLARADRVIK